jgi:hypothetical protein
VFSSGLTGLVERALLTCVCLLFVDLAFFGPGIALPGVPLSPRRLLFLSIVGLATFRHLLKRQLLTLSEILLGLLTLAFFSIWVVALPRIYGFELTDSLADATPWLALLVLVIWPWDAWPLRAQWLKFCKYLTVLSVMLAAIHILVWALLVSGVITSAMLAIATQVLQVGGGDDGGDSFIKIAATGTGQFRVYWSSSVFLLCGLYLLMTYRPERRKLTWSLALLLILFALWTTQIRAFLAAAVLFLLLGWAIRVAARMFGPLNAKALALGAWVIGVLGVSIAINPEVLGSTGLQRGESDAERLTQAVAIVDRVVVHPWLGTGFGSYATSVMRSDDAPFSYELVFYALLMKVGVAGVVVLLMMLFCMLSIARIEDLSRSDLKRFSSWVAFTTGFWFAGATNPLVLNFVGMGILVVLVMDARLATQAPDAQSETLAARSTT